MTIPPPRSPQPRRVFLLGATGTIGRATARALLQRGHEVVCLVRPRAGVGGALAREDSQRLLAGAALRFGDVTDPASLARDGFRGERLDEGRATLQDRFLAASIRQRMGMTVFLVNGVMLQGEVIAFNRFSMLLGRGEQVQLVYKHAVSTMQPASQLNLGETDSPDEEVADDRGEAA